MVSILMFEFNGASISTYLNVSKLIPTPPACFQQRLAESTDCALLVEQELGSFNCLASDSTLWRKMHHGEKGYCKLNISSKNCSFPGVLPELSDPHRQLGIKLFDDILLAQQRFPGRGQQQIIGDIIL